MAGAWICSKTGSVLILSRRSRFSSLRTIWVLLLFAIPFLHLYEKCATFTGIG